VRDSYFSYRSGPNVAALWLAISLIGKAPPFEKRRGLVVLPLANSLAIRANCTHLPIPARTQIAILANLALYSPSGAEVAQLVEQRIRNAWVGGSIPSFGTNKIKDLRAFCWGAF
jgi:hypothetical protein